MEAGKNSHLCACVHIPLRKHIVFEEICTKIWGDFILMGQSMNSFKFGRLKKTEAKQSNGSMKRKSGFSNT